MIIHPYAVNMSLSPVETFHETSLQFHPFIEILRAHEPQFQCGLA